VHYITLPLTNYHSDAFQQPMTPSPWSSALM